MFSNACTTRRVTQVTILALIFIDAIYARFNTTECGTTKGCLFHPNKCNVTEDCNLAFSYQSEGKYLNMEISGKPPKNGYIAVGFSHDDLMGDDMVVYCAMTGGSVVAGLARNEGKKAVMLDYAGVQEVLETAGEEGIIYCAIRQLLKPNRPVLFPLDAAYQILFAAGPFTDNKLSFHSIQDSLPYTLLTAYAKDVGQVAEEHPETLDQKPSTASQLRKAHGIAMVLSWTIFLSTGMLFARNKQGPCPSTMLCGLKLWFHCHRTLNLIGIAGTIAGVVCMMIASDFTWTGPLPGQSSEMNWRWGSIHSLVGLIACVIAWIQPLDAMLRCHPGEPMRMVFNIFHGMLGFLSWICAVAAILIAVIKFPGMFSNNKVAASAFAIFLFVSVQTIISTELLSLVRDKPKVKKTEKQKEKPSTKVKSADNSKDADKPDSKDNGSLEPSKSKEDIRTLSKEDLRSKEGSREQIKNFSKEDVRDHISSNMDDSEMESVVESYVNMAHQIRLGVLTFFIIVAVVVGSAISLLIANKPN